MTPIQKGSLGHILGGEPCGIDGFGNGSTAER